MYATGTKNEVETEKSLTPKYKIITNSDNEDEIRNRIKKGENPETAVKDLNVSFRIIFVES